MISFKVSFVFQSSPYTSNLCNFGQFGFILQDFFKLSSWVYDWNNPHRNESEKNTTTNS